MLNIIEGMDEQFQSTSKHFIYLSTYALILVTV